MFAAMRLPAARRFAATTLRATITGSDNFISILVFEAIAAKRFYRIAASRILRPDLQSWIRNEGPGLLAPDWLRIGTDITHQGPFDGDWLHFSG